MTTPNAPTPELASMRPSDQAEREALLPCPFCGASASGYGIDPHTHALRLGDFQMPDHPGSYIIEGDCSCGSGLIGATQEEVSARWNSRACTSPSFPIDFKQATELLAMFGGEPCVFTLSVTDGHSGRGLYATYTEYPEEGSEFLGVTDCWAVPDGHKEAVPMINGEPATAHSLLAALIDIHDDYKAAPEDRCYVDEAWEDCLIGARAFLAANPVQEMAQAGLGVPGQRVASEQETPETIQAKVDRINLSVMRRFTSMWHADAVRLGYDGVSSLLESLLASREQASTAPKSAFLQKADAQWEENGRLLGRAISVFGDVLGDIGDWEDKALAKAVTEARNGLLRVAMTDKPSNICTDAARAIKEQP